MPRPRTLLAAAVIPLLTLAMACSSSDDAPADTTTTSVAEPSTVADTTSSPPPADSTTTAESSEDLEPALVPYADAIAAVLSDPDDGLGFDAARASCVGGGWARAIGYDTFRSRGIEPGDIDDADDLDDDDLLGAVDEATASTMYETFAACDADYVGVLFSALEDDDVTPEQMACYEDALTDEAAREMFIASFMDDDDRWNVAGASLLACAATSFDDDDLDDLIDD